MRANSVQREPELQRQWAAQRTYETLRDDNPGVRRSRPLARLPPAWGSQHRLDELVHI